MCTATLRHDGAVLDLAMNRDERIARGAEIPPAPVPLAGGHAAVMPRDSDAGGTWAGANTHGLVACILNDCREPAEASPTASRGALVAEALACASLADAEALVGARLVAGRFSPFTLLLAQAGTCVVLRRGGRWTAAAPLFLTSSSWNTEPVEAYRARLFQQWRAAGAPEHEGVPAYHFLGDEARREWNPLMRRAETRMRSVIRLRADRAAARVDCWYWSEPALAPAAASHVAVSAC
jgi:hypothetical protein